ncbi:hypothetical protein N7499_012040 [Penicillium canescens]|uniref:Rhodopsin domain-containing protein n=1 Tax=Penicillium canescens TaxID=5083 RepID=A0AAD6ILW9_PENCN|nr:uncharacterized protein N7446_007315 [Penicillium canescens]KAJ5991388.1 hypothetical protein N7522_011595 [Penicillium canescens]KAJ6049354.1 hypothetical protein N7444_006070 [Penicillium canescens]KAJ6052673.1 hypothetical protein N7460_003207 [Penicillium canescens]KAJ6063195.1 hypothetical protein N7446_007315 [Penicillium canescens]KAJ6070153.1 hypothetical protein N7499_012040 [Penicillium canescens]
MSLETSRSRAVFVGVSAAWVLATVVVCARLIRAFGFIKRRSLEDCIILLAWILAFGVNFAVDFGTFKGLGYHQELITTEWASQLVKSEYVALILFNPALMATESAILLLYINISRGQKFLRVGSWITLVLANVRGVLITFLTAFQCSPVVAAFDPSIEDATCFSIEKIYIASAPVNIAIDLAILVLPIPALTSLSLPLVRKAIVILAFILGVIFITVIDVARIYYLQLAATNLSQIQSTKLATNREFSYNASMALLWSAAHINVGIVGACMPTLGPLFALLARNALLKIWETRRFVQRSSSTVELPQLQNPRQASPSIPGTATPAQLQLRASTQPAAEPCTEDLQPSCNGEVAMNFGSIPPGLSDFGFVNLREPECILDMRSFKSTKYCFFVCILLFLVVFLEVLLFSVAGLAPVVRNRIQTIGITSATYGGIALAPTLGYRIVCDVGFKATFLTSLGLCCVGTLMFWPSAALLCYPSYLVSTAIVGMAAGLLDLTANTFLVLCGPPCYAEVRVLFGQGVEAIAGTIGNVLSEKVIFQNIGSDQSLIAVQWTYLAISVFVVLLGIFYYYLPLPEVTDSQLRAWHATLPLDDTRRFFGRIPSIVATTAIATLSVTCATGAVVCLRGNVDYLLSSISGSTGTSPVLKTANFQIVVTAIDAVGLFFAALLCLFIPPRVVLLADYVCAIVCSALIVTFNWPSAGSLQAMTFALSLFLWPLPNFVVAIALRGIGKWTKRSACLIYVGVGLGGCIFPFVMWAATQSHFVQYSFSVIVALFSTGTLFPVYLVLVPDTQVPWRAPCWRAL